MKFNKKIVLGCIILLVSLPAGAFAAGKIVKWVDEKGETHYGDTIPPQYAGQQHSEINKQGATVKTTAATKTSEEVAAEQSEKERLAALKAEEKRVTDEQATRDRLLLDTFSSEDDIAQTRDRKIGAIDAVIKFTADNSEKLNKRLAEMKVQATKLQKAGKPVPDPLQKDIKEAETQDADYTTFIKSKHDEQEALRVQTEADLKRFREIHPGKTAQQP